MERHGCPTPHLLLIAQRPDELIYRDGLLVCEQVLLCCQPAGVDQDVGVRCTQAE